jgi:hypothetical protein
MTRYIDLDRTLAYTALLELDPGFRKMTVDKSSPVIRQLAEAMTAADPKDRWAFAKAHIEARLQAAACENCGCAETTHNHA